MFPKQGKKCVQQMFDLAMKDLSPMSSSVDDGKKSNYTFKDPTIGSGCNSNVTKEQKDKRNFVSSDR